MRDYKDMLSTIMKDTYDYEVASEEYSYAQAEKRASFVRKTYAHLAGALGLFALIQYFLLNCDLPFVNRLVSIMVQGNSWAIVLVLWMGVSWLADKWARSPTSMALQYTGLLVYIVGISIVFLPLMLVAHTQFEGIITQAAILTGALVLGLFAVVFTTRKDFSFLGASIAMVSMIALGLIFAAIFFGFELGLWFSLAMIVLAAAAILYQTSAVIHHYREDQYVSAALGLFASVAIMYFYVLRMLMQRR